MLHIKCVLSIFICSKRPYTILYKSNELPIIPLQFRPNTTICKFSLELHVEKLCSNDLFMSVAKFLSSTLVILDSAELSSTRFV